MLTFLLGTKVVRKNPTQWFVRKWGQGAGAAVAVEDGDGTEALPSLKVE